MPRPLYADIVEEAGVWSRGLRGLGWVAVSQALGLSLVALAMATTICGTNYAWRQEARPGRRSGMRCRGRGAGEAVVGQFDGGL